MDVEKTLSYSPKKKKKTEQKKNVDKRKDINLPSARVPSRITENKTKWSK